MDLKALTEGKEQKEASEAVFGAANTSIQESLTRLKDRNEDFLKRGLREKGEAVEKALRPLVDKLGLESFKADKDGLLALVEAVGQGGQQKVDLSKLTSEQIQELPAYQKALEDAANANTRYEQTVQEFNSYKQNQQRTAAYNTALTKAISIFEAENAITGNASKADAAKLFLSTIPADRLTVQDGAIIVLDDQGQPITDNFGKATSFTEYVKSNYAFGFGAAPAGSSGSGAGAGASGSGGSSGINITSKEQGEALIKQYHEAGDYEMKAKARRAYSEYLTTNAD